MAIGRRRKTEYKADADLHFDKKADRQNEQTRKQTHNCTDRQRKRRQDLNPTDRDSDVLSIEVDALRTITPVLHNETVRSGPYRVTTDMRVKSFEA